MGFMQKLRQNMPAVVIGLIVMFVALIIFEWGDTSRGRKISGGHNAIASVNGDDISAVEYQNRVTDIINAQRAANPDAPVDEERIREQVWQMMVDEMLIRQEAQRLGITISDDELREVLLYDPPPALKQPFVDSTGTFHQNEYLSFMSDINGFMTARGAQPNDIDKIKKQIKTMEEGIRLDRLREAVQSVVASSAIPSPAEARAAFDDQQAKATGVFALIDATSISDSAVKVSDEDARKYYDAHKGDFQQRNAREVRYAMFNLLPSSSDSSKVAKNLRDVSEALGRATTPQAKDSVFKQFASKLGTSNYNGTSYTPLQEIAPELQTAIQGSEPGAVIGPIRLSEGNFLVNVVDVRDSGEVFVKAQHILLRTAPGGNDDSVKALAEKVFQRAKAGEPFEMLVQQFSADPGSAQRGGDLGYFKKGSMVKPFEDAAFAATTGSIVGPVKTEFGYHIIKVTDRSSKSYKLRDIRFDVKVSNITRNEVSRRAAQFREELSKGMVIDTLAAKQKIQVLESGPIDRLQPAGGSMKLTNFAYAGNVGDVSEVIELQGGGYIVGQISKIRKEGMMEFDDAKQTIIAKIRNQRKLDMIKDKATKLRAQLAAGDSLSKLQQIDPTVQVRPFTDVSRSAPFPGVGFDYGLTNAAFNLKLNQTSDLIRGERGYYIVTVANRTQPTDQEFETEKAKFIQNLIAQRRQTSFQEWLQKQRERASIDDYRNTRF